MKSHLFVISSFKEEISFQMSFSSFIKQQKRERETISQQINKVNDKSNQMIRKYTCGRYMGFNTINQMRIKNQ